MNIAIIGAGASGLAAAGVLQRAHTVVIFEQHADLGGLWNSSNDLQQTALYPSLRTNLPARLMEFFDFPFQDPLIPAVQGDYPGPTAVAAYLRAYAEHHQLRSKIQFNIKVTGVHPLTLNRWSVELSNGQTRPFDAVVVCNGHYTEPNRPVLEGAELYGNKILHAKDYVNPDRFKNQRVLVWGSKASGMDLVREISTTAQHVYWCGHDTGLNQLVTDRANISVHNDPIRLHPDHIQLANDERLPTVDHLVQCTGYQYHFPFLGPELLTIEDNMIHGLYRHILLAKRPTLAFIGLPYLVIPFPLFLIQSQWLAAHLSGQPTLPDSSQLIAHSRAEIQAHLAKPAQSRHFHRLGESQLAYLGELINDADLAPLPRAFLTLIKAVNEARQTHPQNFRDFKMPSRDFHDPRPA